METGDISNGGQLPWEKIRQDLTRSLNNEGALNDVEMQKLREEEIAKLSPEQRRRARNAEQLLKESDETHNKLKEMKIQDLERMNRLIDKSRDDETRKELVELRDRIGVEVHLIDKSYDLAATIARRAIDGEIEASGEARFDPRSGLFTRSVLLNMAPEKFEAGLTEGKDLSDIKLYCLDFLNFKVGNDLLGGVKFDEFFKNQVTTPLIAISISTGDKTYDELAIGKEVAEKLFGTQEKRNQEQQKIYDKLQKMKEEGIMMRVFRDKAGGDEAFLEFEYAKGFTPEREKTALDMVNEIMVRAELPKHTEDKLKAIKTEVEKYFTDTPIKAVNKITQAEADRLNKFAKELYGWQTLKKTYDPITDDPNMKLQMGFAAVETDYAKAFMEFFFAIDENEEPAISPDGTPLKPFIFTNDNGGYEANPECIKEYMQELKIRAGFDMARFSIMTPDDIDRWNKNTMLKDALGLNIQKNSGPRLEQAKAEQKIDLIKKAYLGDIHAAYQVGAMRREGRLGSEISNEQRAEILEYLQAKYKPDL